MGKRGPVKTPTATLAARGNPNVGQRADLHVEVCENLPAAPVHLDGYALDAWNHYGPLLVHQGVITEGDAMALMAMCEVYQEYCETRDDINAGGRYTMVEKKTDEGESAYQIESAASKLHRAARADLRRWLSDFGLTPASRPDVPRSEKPKKAIGDRY